MPHLLHLGFFVGLPVITEQVSHDLLANNDSPLLPGFQNVIEDSLVQVRICVLNITFHRKQMYAHLEIGWLCINIKCPINKSTKRMYR